MTIQNYCSVLIFSCMLIFSMASKAANTDATNVVGTDKDDSIKELNKIWKNKVPKIGTEQKVGQSGDNVLEYLINDDTKKYFGKALYDEQLRAMIRNESIYHWQDFSTKIIFWVVLFLVFTGICFSGIQFFNGTQQKNKSSNQEDIQHHVEISAKGIKVSSPFLGIILLVISLAFLYLYLVYVYPISLTI